MIATIAVLPRFDFRRASFLLAVALFSALSPRISHAQERSYSALPPDTLIDELADIGSPVPDVDGMASHSAFLAEDATPKFTGGVLGTPVPAIPPPMRELVRHGLAALPSLIRHLNDDRPTKLVVGGLLSEAGGFYMFQYFSDEYDPRDRTIALRKPIPGSSGRIFEGAFSGRYTVKVADLCYVLVGQIVNRRLVAVRYQASSGLVINSPLEAPNLIDRIEKDWSGLDAESHKASLITDIRDDDVTRSRAALMRLRFYYPDAYKTLQGAALGKRDAFEAETRRN